MKRVIVVSKTHLDLGFTDYAEAIRKKYIDKYIPGAIALAEKMNTEEKKSFIWTTGSWIIKEALHHGSGEQRESLKRALEKGDIVPHAMPFTTHTELLDEDTLEYGLTILDEIDGIRGKKTVSAKMTDVPGHTKALVPALRRHGIKLLHIGVNGASALCRVPPCFLWKCGGEEIVVIYSGDYGGAYKSELVEEILYFDHTLDNHGAPSSEKIERKLSKIAEEYPGYEVSAGTMDDFAQVIWEQRHRLPVVTKELGDTWIHGAASDPYKSAALRELMGLKAMWLADGTMTHDSREYVDFSDALLCIAEHTCGMDMKNALADYENYLKKDFQRARRADRVKIRHPFRDFPQNIFTIFAHIDKSRPRGSYKTAEASWAEQRGYIDKAVSSLSREHREQAQKALGALIPQKPAAFIGDFDISKPLTAGRWRMTVNEYGGIGSLFCGDDGIIRKNSSPVLEYRSFGKGDYDYWHGHYGRDMKKNITWAYGDFGRPLLKYVEGKYPEGRFPYVMKNAGVISSEENALSFGVNLECDKRLCEELGAPRQAQIVYTLSEKGLKFTVLWYGKDANRLTEALYLRLFPADSGLELCKIGEYISPYAVVSMGGRKLHAVQHIRLNTPGGAYRLTNRHSPLISLGEGKILEFDNKYESIEKDGISYVLYDNVWGTNFPLWYEDNAAFTFTITAD